MEPKVLEACDTCGYDHEYEWQLITDAERLAAVAAHIEAGDVEE